MNFVYVAVGSAVGGVLRFWLGSVAAKWLGAPHLGTMLVNVTGCFAIGFLAARGSAEPIQKLLIVGLLGGYTTFSSFSLQTLELAQENQLGAAGTNVVLSVVLSLVAVWLGHSLGAVLHR